MLKKLQFLQKLTAALKKTYKLNNYTFLQLKNREKHTVIHIIAKLFLCNIIFLQLLHRILILSNIVEYFKLFR